MLRQEIRVELSNSAFTRWRTSMNGVSMLSNEALPQSDPIEVVLVNGDEL